MPVYPLEEIKPELGSPIQAAPSCRQCAPNWLANACSRAILHGHTMRVCRKSAVPHCRGGSKRASSSASAASRLPSKRTVNSEEFTTVRQRWFVWRETWDLSPAEAARPWLPRLARITQQRSVSVNSLSPLEGTTCPPELRDPLVRFAWEAQAGREQQCAMRTRCRSVLARRAVSPGAVPSRSRPDSPKSDASQQSPPPSNPQG